jgi:hypothetical protein
VPQTAPDTLGRRRVWSYAVAMGKGRRRVLTASVLVAAGSMVMVPALPASAHGSQSGPTVGHAKAPKHCHRGHKARCAGPQSSQSVTGTSGGLTVTFTANVDGSTVTFDVASTETQAYGALGPEVLSFGNGASEGFATPEYCLAHPIAESNDRQITYTYSQAGSYTAAVTVGANCTPDQLTLPLTFTVG